MTEHDTDPLDIELPGDLHELVNDMRSDVLAEDRVARVGDRLAPLLLGGAGAVGLGAAAGGAASGGAGGGAASAGLLGTAEAGVVTTAGHGAAAAAAGGTLLGAAKWIGVSLVLLAGAGVLGVSFMGEPQSPPEPPPPADPPVLLPAPPAQTPERLETPEEAQLEPAPIPRPVRRARTRDRAAVTRPVTDREPEAEAPPEGAAEAAPVPAAMLEHRLLRQARVSLRSDPARALELVRDHERNHARGALVPEREVLAIEALTRLDRGNAARSRSAEFLRRWPESPYRQRVESLVR